MNLADLRTRSELADAAYKRLALDPTATPEQIERAHLSALREFAEWQVAESEVER